MITRDELDRMGARLAEFRLFKWLGSFALVAILGGFGLLYEQISDLRVTMERLHGETLQELHTQSAAIQNEIAGVRERVVRLETLRGVESQ